MDISHLVREWILCSNDLWIKLFMDSQTSIDDITQFERIEEILLDHIVLKKLGSEFEKISMSIFFSKLQVKYKKAINENRQLCVEQKSGNAYCRPELVVIAENSFHSVHTIDTKGIMSNGAAYIEIFYKKGFILESPDNLNFIINPPQ